MRTLSEIQSLTDGELRLAIEASTIGVNNLTRIATDTGNKLKAIIKERGELTVRLEQLDRAQSEYTKREQGDHANLADTVEELETLLTEANERKLV